jgi:valine dehydrogenase (NAD+)
VNLQLSDPSPFESDHEQVVYCQDRASGLRAIIAIHSTALGPSLGGTRFYPYRSQSQALDDVLRLSRGMTYKNALAGLDLGGGKAVIIGDPATSKSEALLRAFGRFVQSLHGRYITACDVGTYSVDMNDVARETTFVTGRTTEHGGAGDSSVLTAFGVYQGMRACAQHTWANPSLRGRRVGIEGVGKVGRHLVAHVLAEGADVVVCDPNDAAVHALLNAHPEVKVVADSKALIAEPLDIYAPCALGGSLTEESVQSMSARIVCGAANNQLQSESVATLMADRSIVYAPDFCVNAGGVIQVADELQGFDFERAKQRASAIFDTTARVLEVADQRSITPEDAALEVARERIESASHLRGLYVP